MLTTRAVRKNLAGAKASLENHFEENGRVYIAAFAGVLAGMTGGLLIRRRPQPVTAIGLVIMAPEAESNGDRRPSSQFGYNRLPRIKKEAKGDAIREGDSKR